MTRSSPSVRAGSWTTSTATRVCFVGVGCVAGGSRSAAPHRCLTSPHVWLFPAGISIEENAKQVEPGYDMMTPKQQKDLLAEVTGVVTSIGKSHGQGKWKKLLLVKDTIADITLQQVLTRAKEFDVIATMNLNGDYLRCVCCCYGGCSTCCRCDVGAAAIELGVTSVCWPCQRCSDALAAQVGGIGIAPGGNINYISGHAIFEATHGTAPKYANLDKVNPGSVILSGEMMFRHLGWNEAADLIIKGIDTSIKVMPCCTSCLVIDVGVPLSFAWCSPFPALRPAPSRTTSLASSRASRRC